MGGLPPLSPFRDAEGRGPATQTPRTWKAPRQTTLTTLKVAGCGVKVFPSCPCASVFYFPPQAVFLPGSEAL